MWPLRDPPIEGRLSLRVPPRSSVMKKFSWIALLSMCMFTFVGCGGGDDDTTGDDTTEDTDTDTEGDDTEGDDTDS